MNNLQNYCLNPYDEYKCKADKVMALQNAANVYAIDSKGNSYPVKNYAPEQLAFVVGFWRIQNSFPYEITRVRDKDMVLIKKLDRIENNMFEFYNAKHVNYNCYGPFIIDIPETDYVVTKYETDKGTYCRYDKTLESALKNCDEYKQIINTTACKNKIAQHQ